MIQIYTGEGKGKTTASVGIAIRASKHFKVLFVQLIKNGKSSEITVLKKIPSITVRTFGEGKRILTANKNEVEKTNSKKALNFIVKSYTMYDTIIVDEAVTAVNLKLLSETDILELLGRISDGREIILTGRGATRKLIDRADLVTEMKKIKHYYDKGQKARKGIEF